MNYNLAVSGDTLYLVVTAPNIKVQAMSGDSNPSNNTIRPYLRLVNADNIAYPYGQLTLRYWFTPENYDLTTGVVDYAQIGNANLQMQYVQLQEPHSGAFGYIEYSFLPTAGALPADSSSGPIQSRIFNTDYAMFNELDDYSYMDTSAYTDNTHITLYRNGKLIWGTEPDTVAKQLLLRSYTQNESSGANTLSKDWVLSNEGNVAVTYSDLTVRYWFTAEDSATLNDWIDYAALGSGNITGQFVTLSPALDSADAYFEVGFAPSLGTLYPLSNTGDIKYRITKADWSNFIDSNDYSYLPGTGLQLNNHTTVYYKGQLVFGTPPSAAGTTKHATPVLSAAGALLQGNGTASLNLSISPNPVVSSSVRISVTNTTGEDAILTLTDLSGRSLYSRLVEGHTTAGNVDVDLKGRAAGIYFITIRTKHARITKTLIKE